MVNGSHGKGGCYEEISFRVCLNGNNFFGGGNRVCRSKNPVLQKMIKQRQESVELYQKGNRADLVKQEQEEIAIISGYLPKQMSEAEMAAAIDAAIKETGAAGMKDMGKVIGSLRGKYAGQMDMAKASAAVKAKLSG